MPEPTPVLVAGMHRSGTSLIAAFLSALGVDMGDPIPADSGNPGGYFEDAGFVDLNRRVLHASAAADDGGHRDWGWTESEQLDRRRFAEFRDEALALADGRSRSPRTWGWKDPRATLLLDDWSEIVPSARYLLLYRFPWDVADSMQRLGADVFLEQPDYAHRIWTFYNRHLLRFYRRHRDRAVLASTNAVTRDPRRFVALLRDKLGLDLGEASLEEVYDREKFVTVEGCDPLIGLVAATSAECVRLLRQLDDEADLSSAGLWQAPDIRPGVSRPETKADHQQPVDLSIVIPCFDDGQFLIEAVASVERSAAGSCELIIVNDGSRQPRTLEVLEILGKAGYEVIEQDNSGLSAARNRAIAAARGRYILPLDADNRLLPGFPEAAIRVLDGSSEIDVVYGDCREFGKRSGRRNPPDFDLDLLLRGNYIDACAVFRKEIWFELGGYDAAASPLEDWELWIHAAKSGCRFHRLDEVTFDYRVRPGSLLTRVEDPATRDGIVNHVVAKHRDLYHRQIKGYSWILGVWFGIAEAERARLRHDRDTFQEELRRSVDELAAAQDKEARLSEKLAAERERRGIVEAERASLQDELAAERERLAIVEAERASLQDELAAERERLAIVETERAQFLHDRDTFQNELRQRSDELSVLRNEEVSLQEELAAGRGRLLALEDEVSRATEELAAERERAAAREDDVSNLEASLASTERRSAAQRSRLRIQGDVLDQIHSSLGWRLASFAWRSVDRLLPVDSRRRRLYDRLVGRLKGGS